MALDNTDRMTYLLFKTGSVIIEASWDVDNSYDYGRYTALPLTAHRFVVRTIGNSQRAFFGNGEAKNTSPLFYGIPSTSGEPLSFLIGYEDSSYAQPMLTGVDKAYLRLEIMSAAWIGAEYDSWENTGFYNVA